MKRNIKIRNLWFTALFFMVLTLSPQLFASTDDIAVVNDNGNTILCPGCTKLGKVTIKNAVNGFYNEYDDDFDFVFVFLQRMDAPNLLTDPDDDGYYGHVFPTAKAPAGTGAELPVNNPQEFGSSGRLKVVGDMYYVDNYPTNPNEKYYFYSVMGLEIKYSAYTAVAMVGRAMMRYWGAYIQGMPGLLAGNGFWSYFFDSGNSVLGGNSFYEMSPGEYRTEASSYRPISSFERYLMGLESKDEVDDLFYLTNTSSDHSASDPPSTSGDYFNTATKHEFTIEDVIAKNGTVNMDTAQKEFTCAFVLVVPGGVDARTADLTKLDALRLRYQSWFLEQTDSKAKLNCKLTAGVDGDTDGGSDLYCINGEHRCNQNVLEICGNENWGFVKDCDNSNLLCSEEYDDCIDPDQIDGDDTNTCSPGDVRCKPGSDTIFERCDGGNWTYGDDCNKPNQKFVCYEGACKDPSEVPTDGDQVVSDGDTTVSDGDQAIDTQCVLHTDCPTNMRCTSAGCMPCPNGQNWDGSACVAAAEEGGGGCNSANASPIIIMILLGMLVVINRRKVLFR